MKLNLARHRFNLLLVSLLLVAFVLRAGIGIAQRASYWALQDVTFWDIARNLVDSHVYGLQPDVPTAKRAPVYPSFLALCYWLFDTNIYGLIAANCLVNTLVVAMTYALGRLIFGRRAGFLAATGVALYPYLVWQSQHLIDTGMLSLLLLCLVYAVLKAQQTDSTRWAILAGICGGLAYLTRSVVGPFLAVAVLWWLLTRRTSRIALFRALLFLLVAGLCVLPWIVRNTITFHELILSEGPGGVGTFWRGNNPALFLVYPQYTPDSLAPYENRLGAAAGSSISEQDAFWGKDALAYIRTHPTSFIAGTLRKALLMWDWQLVPRSFERAKVDAWTGRVLEPGRPRPLGERMLYTLPYLGMLLFAIPGLAAACHTHRQLTLLLCLPLLSWTCVHALLYPVTRYRMPVEPIVMIFAGYGFTRIVSRTRLPGWGLPGAQSVERQSPLPASVAPGGAADAWLRRASLPYHCAFDLCAGQAKSLGGAAMIVASGILYAREIVRRLDGDVMLCFTPLPPRAEAEVGVELGPDVDHRRVTLSSLHAAAARPSARCILWLEPEKETWREVLSQVRTRLSQDGQLYVLGTTPLRRLLPEWRADGSAPAAMPLDSSRSLVAELKRLGFVVQHKLGFHGPVSLLLGKASRLFAVLGRYDLVDRCLVAMRQTYMVRGWQADWSPVWVLVARRDRGFTS